MVLTDGPKKVAIWIRVSSEDQARGESPRTHEQRARMYAEIKGWHVVTLYDLSGISGKTVLDHPESRRMVEDVRAGRIDALIFSRLARLARNTKELLEIAEIFKQHNASLVSLGESIDTSTPAGMLLFTVLGALAEWERSEISARVAASVPIRAAMGKPTGGHGPFGYRWDQESRRLVVDPAAAEVVRAIFRVFLEEQGNKARTVRRLGAMGVRTRNGAKWAVTSVTRMLDNTAYAGRRVANYSRSTGDKKHWKRKPEHEWVYHDVEPIIDMETWEKTKAYQVRRAAEKTTMSGVPKESKHLFGGLLVCACGKKLYMRYHPKKTPKYRCNGCRRLVAESDLVVGMLDVFRRITIEPELLEEQAPQIDLQATQSELAALAKEIALGRKRKANLLDLYGDERITKPDLFGQLKEAEDSLAVAEQRAGELEEVMRRHEAAAISRAPMLERAESLRSLWRILSPDEQRQVVRELIDSVEVSDAGAVFVLFHAADFGKESHTVRGSWPPPA